MERSVKKVRKQERFRSEKVEKRRPKRSLLTAVWGLSMCACLGIASYTFITTDFSKKQAFSNVEIDPVTTASIGNRLEAADNTQSLDNRRTISEQNSRLQTLSAVIERLQKDQKILKTRIAELDRTISNLRSDQDQTEQETADVSENVNEEVITHSVQSGEDQKANADIPVVAPAQQLPPEVSIESNPRAVSVNTIEIPKTVFPKPVAKEKAANNPEAVQEPVSRIHKSKPKKKAAQNEPIPVIDPTVVSSIEPDKVGETRFGLDLGVNPTAIRAKDLWDTLSADLPEVFSSISPRYVATAEDDGQVRLLAGPYGNAADAIKACVALRIAKSFCKTTLFPHN